MSGTTIGANGALLASWTTAGRPASPVAGQMGWNSTLGALDFYNGSAWLNISDINVDASGNVGIGTSSPNTKLTINSNNTDGILIRTSDTNYSTISMGVGTISNYAYIQTTINGSGTQQPLAFFIGSSERARIDTSGNLLVGTTSFSTTNGGLISNYNSGTSTHYIGHISGSSGGSGYAVFQYNGGLIGSITQNGTTGVLYNLTSDYRLKNNPEVLTGAKEFVMALQPKKWQWWDGSGEGVGFIAHEFMEVAKYSGHGEKDAVDENGNIIPQSIQPSSSEVMANLVSFIQEQQAIITSQTQQITQLQSDLSALVTRISALEAPKSAS